MEQKMSNKYNIIQIISLNRRFTPVLYTLILCISLYLGGCQTTKIENVDETQLPAKKDYEILSVVLKNGEKLSLENKSPRFEIIYKGIPNVLLYYTKDTTIVETDKIKRLSYKEHMIQFSDIKSVKIQTIHVNTALLILGIIGGTLLFFLLIAGTGFKHSGGGSVLHGEL
jgi:hypothetical protein